MITLTTKLCKLSVPDAGVAWLLCFTQDLGTATLGDFPDYTDPHTTMVGSVFVRVNYGGTSFHVVLGPDRATLETSHEPLFGGASVAQRKATESYRTHCATGATETGRFTRIRGRKGAPPTKETTMVSFRWCGCAGGPRLS